MEHKRVGYMRIGEQHNDSNNTSNTRVIIIGLVFISGFFLLVHTKKDDEEFKLSNSQIRSHSVHHLGYSPVSDFAEELTSSRTVVIGIGTGRCGTLAFSHLVDQQQNTSVSHEFHQCKNYEWNSATREKAEARFQKYTKRKGKVVGDIALWNLPYVEYYLEHPEVKIIVLKRNRTDCINSFKKWFGGLNHFPWITKAQRARTSYADMDAYDPCYPQMEFKWKDKSDQPSIGEGAEIYYDYYYEKVDELSRKHRGRFLEIDTYDILNKEETKSKVLKWLGVVEPFELHGVISSPNHQTNGRNKYDPTG